MGRTVTLKAIFKDLPEYPALSGNVRRAPKRELNLGKEEMTQAIKNALRYVPEEWHTTLAPEFKEELLNRGRIYGYRFMPKTPPKGLPVDAYRGKTLEGRAFQVMIDNNLDHDVALYPYELVTYGETGQVFQNWMQYQLVKRYLEVMEQDETLVIASGHPLGLFKSFNHAPRVTLTNGLMIGMYDNAGQFNRAQALGVANYGQMTAGGWMYIGPQGIVHGTYSTLLNAGRIKLDRKATDDLGGVLFVSSGLGGMSGAQGKAVHIAGGVGIIAEVDGSRIETRYHQGWVDKVTDDVAEAFNLAHKAQKDKAPIAIAYHGNVVDLLVHAIKEGIPIDLLSDQTSCHNAYDGGYTPYTLTYEERTRMLQEDKDAFIREVNKGLRKHYELIKSLTEKGTYFFDYGNSFMKAVYDAGVQEICKNKKNDLDGFIWPSYVEDIMGPILFDYGYGPFRWVCLSGKEEDLEKTDKAAMEAIDPDRRFQDKDNYRWIKDAKNNKLVVGTKARILYQDAHGRRDIALAFNALVRSGAIGPIMIGRDHHDTGGTDSPFRETSNIKDGSNVMADMATLVYANNASRGMSLVALHNGGGVGVSKAVNGGYGLVLDGTKEKDAIIKRAMMFDVIGGVARRAWAQNIHAIETASSYNANDEGIITLPEAADQEWIESLFETNDKKEEV
ncbi:MAG: urocanate hydratase [Candidatus Izemoplasmataceae bacterium]